MNYFSVIRPPAGQITQPQSCAFFPGDDWKRTTLDRSSLLATRGWSTSHRTSPWTPLGLRKAGPFYDSFVSSCVAPGNFVWSSPSRERGSQFIGQYLSVHKELFCNPPTNRRLEEAIDVDWFKMMKFKAP
ncbi:hypothetical protein AVEN_72905-1 [Araneus ventricosus]|uniref:Uncharacterized protein n=1 Tax=Araneus ventricosus TaxID=182803 RepID=A0A4Y2UX87_ARAVE|nr:hypothetical protein AVEN_72905-1 [Araneus ventricosus]